MTRDFRGELWSLIRDALQRGAAIELESETKGRPYEEHSARMDAAARELADRFVLPGWQTDFSACPRDRPVELLSWKDGKVIGFWVSLYRNQIANYWREFVPPMRKENNEQDS